MSTKQEVLDGMDRLQMAHRKAMSNWYLSRGIKDDTHWLGELLAVIHGDGGHYQEKHGTEKAVRDALEIINNLRGAESSHEGKSL